MTALFRGATDLAHGNPAADTDSGKAASDENFPVGSFLISARLRPAVAAFYAFARSADDVADHAQLAPEDKLARLDSLAAALQGAPAQDALQTRAARLRAALAAQGLGVELPLTLLSAFRQDVTQRRYATLAELEDYCARSACPVGRFLVDLHGESASVYPASDALCCALQVLNHLQDCGADYRTLDRVYLPADLLAAAGASVEHLARDRTSPELRATLDRLLDRCRTWNAQAAALAPALQDRRFAAEAGAIVKLAARLTRRLAVGDPLATRVKLSRLDFAGAILSALGAALGPRAR